MAAAASKMRAQPAVNPRRLHEITAAAAEFYAHQLPGHQPATDYLRSRGIADAAAPGSPWQLGYAPAAWRSLLNHLAPRFPVEEQMAAGLLTYNRNGGLIDRFRGRLVFPIADHTAQIAGFTARDLSGRDRTPKWVNSPDTPIYAKSRLLYGLGPQLQHRPPGQATPLVLIVEGATDALAVWKMAQTMPHLPGGIPIHAVAPCGTNLTTQQLQLLKDHLPAGTRLAVALDGDPAGRVGFLRAYPMLRDWPDRTWAIALPAGHDPASLLAEHGPDDALAELAKQMAPAARTALAYTLDQQIADGLIPQPLVHLGDRLNVGQSIVGYVLDDPADLPKLAGTAADRLGLAPGEVTQLAVAQIPTPAYLDEYATPAEADEYIATYLIQPADPDSDLAPEQQPSPATAGQDEAPNQQPQPEPEPGSEPQPEPAPEPVEVDREQPPPPVTWVSASQHRRWPAADAAEAAIDRATGRWAWALTDGIGERPPARAAADIAARVAARAAARANPAAGIAAAGAALHTNPAAGDEDAAITVATAHPAAAGATRVDLAWSGNVRAYALLGEQVIQVTSDHTVAQQHREAGHRVTADSQLHHLLTSSVRHGPVSRTSIVLPPGGTLLLATAGAYRNLDPIWLRQALRPTADPQVTVNRLLHHTANGDNARALLLRAPTDHTGPPAAGDPARLARLAGAATPAGRATQAAPAGDTTGLIAQLRSQLADSHQRARTAARR